MLEVGGNIWCFWDGH